MPARARNQTASEKDFRAPELEKSEDALKRVLDLLRAQTGHDFTQYKQNTILRRVERRMAVRQIEHLDAYVLHMQETPAEIEALFRDLLIGVTSFFRDPEAFQVLEIQVIPRLIADKQADSVVRVWVPGCSTGEEAYSIAILLREKLDALKRSVRVQVFATDIDARAIQTARASVYPASIAADIAPERLARHFSQMQDGNYCVHKRVRDLLIFSEQDVTKDPPFSKLDFISCRNLMIYMGPDLQKRLIPLFHHALNPAGALFLGTSESVGDFGQLFSTTDRKARLYQRQNVADGAPRPMLGNARPAGEGVDARAPSRKALGETKIPVREITERALLEDAPVAATTNEELKSSNEELRSTNEELQSSNEELETSEEELQSVNEELATVNAELLSKVTDLSRVNNDINNLLAGTGIGTVFVDHQLHIRRFTPAITQFINLIQSDVGRPLGHIVSNLVGYDRLVADVKSVLNTLEPGEVEVQTRAGGSYRLRILPYRTLENVVEGAVITFTEMTAIKGAQARMERGVTN